MKLLMFRFGLLKNVQNGFYNRYDMNYNKKNEYC